MPEINLNMGSIATKQILVTPDDGTTIEEMHPDFAMALELEQTKKAIKQLTERKEQLERELVKHVGVNNSVEFGDAMTIKISEGRKTLNASMFEQKFPPAEHPSYYQLKPLALSQLTKRLGEDALYEVIIHGKPTVKVAVNEQQ